MLFVEDGDVARDARRLRALGRRRRRPRQRAGGERRAGSHPSARRNGAAATVVQRQRDEHGDRDDNHEQHQKALAQRRRTGRRRADGDHGVPRRVLRKEAIERAPLDRGRRNLGETRAAHPRCRLLEQDFQNRNAVDERNIQRESRFRNVVGEGDLLQPGRERRHGRHDARIGAYRAGRYVGLRHLEVLGGGGEDGAPGGMRVIGRDACDRGVVGDLVDFHDLAKSGAVGARHHDVAPLYVQGDRGRRGVEHGDQRVVSRHSGLAQRRRKVGHSTIRHREKVDRLRTSPEPVAEGVAAIAARPGGVERPGAVGRHSMERDPHSRHRHHPVAARPHHAAAHEARGGVRRAPRLRPLRGSRRRRRGIRRGAALRLARRHGGEQRESDGEERHKGKAAAPRDRRYAVGSGHEAGRANHRLNLPKSSGRIFSRYAFNCSALRSRWSDAPPPRPPGSSSVEKSSSSASSPSSTWSVVSSDSCA